MKQDSKVKRNILVGFRATRLEYASLAAEAAGNNRTIAGEIRNRVFDRLTTPTTTTLKK